MPASERRRKPREKAHLLSAFRFIEGGDLNLAGFVRTLNVSEAGALLESPDPFPVGQRLALELLLDEDRVIRVDAQVVRVTHSKEAYHIGVAFADLTPANRRLIEKQVHG